MNYLLCTCKRNIKTEIPVPVEIPIEGIISIIFQNIAYTSTSNYRKWFYNTYKIKSFETTRRDRRYSLHEEIDFDNCISDRKINKNDSIDSLMDEVYLCKEPLNIYYIPFTQLLLPIFDKHIEYFDNNIISIKIPNGKIKFFDKNNAFFISFIFDKNIILSSNKIIPIEIGKNRIYIDEQTESFVNGFFSIAQIYDILHKMMNSYKIVICGHYKNCIFIDIIIYYLLLRIRKDIYYFAIAPIIEHSNILYKKLNKKIKYYLFNDTNPSNIDKFIQINNPESYICCSGSNTNNYRKNLKNISCKILQDFL